jgi:hypothetical protein
MLRDLSANLHRCRGSSAPTRPVSAPPIARLVSALPHPRLIIRIPARAPSPLPRATPARRRGGPTAPSVPARVVALSRRAAAVPRPRVVSTASATPLPRPSTASPRAAPRPAVPSRPAVSSPRPAVSSPQPPVALPRPPPVVFAPSPLHATVLVSGTPPHGASSSANTDSAPALPRSVALTRAEERRLAAEASWRR